MQAHSLSKPAARDPLLPTGFDDVTLSTPMYDPKHDTALSLTSALPPHGQECATVRVSGRTPARTHVDPALGLAHDARNLIAAIGLYCDLLDRPGVLQAQHRHYAAELRQLAGRSGKLMTRALAPRTGTDLRAEDALPTSSTAQANPADILRELAPLLSAIAAPAAVVTLKTPRVAPVAALPAETLERIVVNLVRNAAQAIEFAFGGSGRHHIRIALASLAGHLQLTVEDDGPGMPVATAAAFLSPSPLPRGAQHGLGHRIVHDLVTASGGRLAIRVRPGRGTVFCIKWPMPSPGGPALDTSSTRSAAPAADPHGVRTC